MKDYVINWRRMGIGDIGEFAVYNPSLHFYGGYELRDWRYQLCIYEGESCIASFYISKFSHNCGILVVGGLSCGNEEGYVAASKLLAQLMKGMRYTLAMYTTVEIQEDIINFLKKDGWTAGLVWRNKRSGNDVTNWHKEYK